MVKGQRDSLSSPPVVFACKSRDFANSENKLCTPPHSNDKNGMGSKASLCVYTIRHSDDLRACVTSGGRGTFHERKRWTLARELLLQAESKSKNLLILFSPAEGTRYLFGFAVLETIEFTAENGTDFTFRNLKRFKRPAAQGLAAQTRWNRVKSAFQ